MWWKKKAIITFKLFENNFSTYFQRRWKAYSKHSMMAKKKSTSKDKALEHFDDFYGNVFKNHWPSMRLALLSSQKYIAVVNNYSDTERIMSYLENLGGINVSKLLEIQEKKMNESGRSYISNDGEVEIVQEKMKRLSERKQEEELSSLYPPSKMEDKYPSKVSIGPIRPQELEKFSSEDRLIEPSLGLSAPAVSEFVPATELIGMEDWVPESQHYSYYADSQDHPIKIVEQHNIEFPKHLHVFTFESGNVERFPSPKNGTTGVSDYYLLNGGSLLPVLALDLKPGDSVLDMCAAPGGKGLLCLQTLYPRTLVLNDLKESRVNKIKKVMIEFLYNFDDKKEKGEIILTLQDGRFINVEDTFNKILIDVPCTTDRHCVMEEDNNIFKIGRIKERIKIPELQSELLINALKLIKVGGIVVYSTCSLAPTQNDGVVAFALRKLSEQTSNEYIIVDMKKALKPLEIMYNYGSGIGLKCGHLVVPYLPANFGPTYFCKIVRVK